MTPHLRTLAFAAAVSLVAVGFTGGAPALAAAAQTAAPTVSAPLSEATIKALQEALNAQGIAVAVDGTLGDETRAAIRRYQSEHHLAVTGEPDKATLDKLGVAGQQSEGPPDALGPDMAGMTMPGMMQMMQRMPGAVGMPGMMANAHGTGQGGPNGSMTMCPMMQMAGAAAASPQRGMEDVALLYGVPQDAREEMTPERVRTLLQQRLAEHRNPRLKLGDVATPDESTVTAEIVTVDGSLVQKLAFNRYPGLLRPLP